MACCLASAGRRSTNIFSLPTACRVYDGCEFGCPYCDGWAYRTRPFNETVRIATDLPTCAAEEIDSIDRGDLIGITALTDPYQPVEATYRLTRQLLACWPTAANPA